MECSWPVIVSTIMLHSRLTLGDVNTVFWGIDSRSFKKGILFFADNFQGLNFSPPIPLHCQSILLSDSVSVEWPHKGQFWNNTLGAPISDIVLCRMQYHFSIGFILTMQWHQLSIMGWYFQSFFQGREGNIRRQQLCHVLRIPWWTQRRSLPVVFWFLILQNLFSQISAEEAINS